MASFFAVGFAKFLILPSFFPFTGENRVPRSSRSQMFFKIGVLKILGIFTRKRLCWSLFLIKLQTLRPATLLKETPTRLLSCEICQIFKNTFFTEHLWWLLLGIKNLIHEKANFRSSCPGVHLKADVLKNSKMTRETQKVVGLMK